MNEDQINLARRAVACKHWRWVQGMQWTAPHIDGVVWNNGRVEHPPANAFSRIAIPVLSDPATLGCLLRLVREAWGDPYIYVMRAWNGWQVVSLMHPTMFPDFSTEAAALVAALEAAP
jgi:hypothetical protein